MEDPNKGKFDNIKKILEEDHKNEWWRPSSIDNYDIKKKMFRVGCRPLKRKYLSCLYQADYMDSTKYAYCKDLKSELDECYRLLHYVYITEQRGEQHDFWTKKIE